MPHFCQSQDKLATVLRADQSGAHQASDRHDAHQDNHAEPGIFWSIGSKLDKGQSYSEVGATEAHDGDDRVIYDSKVGNLYYDRDGLGGSSPILFATLSNKPTKLDHLDFIIV